MRGVTQASGVYGTLAYSYDAVGNRLSETGGNNALAQSYGYAGGSNQLLSVANGGTTRLLSYTAAGNLASNDNGAGTVLGFSYNQQNRLVQATSQGIAVAQYQQNFLGERVAKGTLAGITQFHYDRAGRLIAESDNLGTVLREHIWMDDLPVGYVAAGAVYYVHPDHLGAPQRITDGGQNLVWDAAFTPFGEVAQVNAGVTENLRFPGQYADAETGLNYNFFRDYDPTVGRYVESDPIGLRGGINTYAYVGENPISLNDPLGLWPLPFGMGIPSLGVPSQAQATAQIAQALQNQGLSSSDASRIAQDITNEAGMGDVTAAQAMQNALQNGQQLTPSQQQAAQQFINRLPSADQGPLNSLLKKYCPPSK